MLVGFFAQLIDGAIGMAYGVSSTTFLLSMGISPAAASASVHVAKIFTTAASGLAHWNLRNVDTGMVKKLLLPGVAGGVTGAFLLVNIDGNLIKPFISAYLIVMGIVILVKAFRPKQPARKSKHIGILGFIGGFFDAIGGGGWGPIVTTTLVAQGSHPRATIGSVNFTEFFVSFAQSVAFVLALSFFEYWQIILGLLLGGVIAAPLAALATRKIPIKVLMVIVGIVIILLSIRTFWI
ncbi:MAG: sulfite exporter TauE/SafE family protein [Chloroflexi bacterium]|nr:MAG: sulfite exporter TauE/SafE family protein [Chloroflexota bacterium]